jgi:hypothetical protein
MTQLDTRCGPLGYGLLHAKKKRERFIFATAQDVLTALRDRYPAQSYAFLTEVGNGTGARNYRHCDALVMSLWPSRGLEIIGFEVKVRRSDWMKELETPEKAEAIAQWCDRWYLVVGDEEIVKAGELPKNWGLFVPRADGLLRCKTEAKLAEPEPEPGRTFLAAVLRSIQAQLSPEAALQAEYHRGLKEGAAEESKKDWHKRDLEELQKKVAAFEKGAGFKIDQGWAHFPENVGQALRQVLNGSASRIQQNLEHLHGKALDIAKAIEDELKSGEQVFL